MYVTPNRSLNEEPAKVELLLIQFQKRSLRFSIGWKITTKPGSAGSRPVWLLFTDGESPWPCGWAFLKC